MKLRKVLIALLLALFTISIITACKEEKNDTIIPEGPETGVYCCYTDAGDYSIRLHDGNKFTLTVNGEKTGVYTVEGTTLNLDFDAATDGVITGTIANDAISITYNAEAMTFYKNTISYTVTFDTAGGSTVNAQQVVYGKKAEKPADPTKPDSAFIGWYTDNTYTTVFDFANTVITENVTVYAYFEDVEEDVTEFSVKFDYNYAGAPEGTVVETTGGKLYGLETPTRDDYTFNGWWVSFYNDGTKLGYKYEEGMEISSNTTLYALWSPNNTDGKLETPVVNVNGNIISWQSVYSAISYQVEVFDDNGDELSSQKVGTTSFNFDFSAAGEYVIKVTAISSNTDKNSETAVRYYKSHALAQVSIFSVEDGVLSFNAVENATNYYVTVVCGNSEHKHDFVNVGSRTNYDFSGCVMVEDGITFKVTATAVGFAQSVSEVFTYVQNLGEVTGLAVNADTQVVTWDAVDNATEYVVTVNGTDYYVGKATYFDLKNFASGNYTVSVKAVAHGYNPSTAQVEYAKTVIATPTDVMVSGNTVSWSMVADVTYKVEVNGTVYDAVDNYFELPDEDDVSTYVIRVAAVADTQSAWSEPVTASATMGSLTYSRNTVYWSPVVGATGYDVKVNDGEFVTVDANMNKAVVTLTKSGDNTVSVRVTGGTESDWVSITVFAYAVSYNTVGGNAVDSVYVAEGDKLPDVTATKAGYDFVAWYVGNTADRNGTKYTDTYFVMGTQITLYASYAPATFRITYKGDSTLTDSYGEAVYLQRYTLGVPESTQDPSEAFIGWYTLPGGDAGLGVKLTNEKGESLSVYNATEDITVYPYFIGDTLTYEKLSDGTYGVKAGPNIGKTNRITIPAYYFDGEKDVAVTRIGAQAFAYLYTLHYVSIPDTIKEIDYTAFYNSSLVSYEIYEVDPEGTYERNYRSYDGAIMYKNSQIGGIWQVRFFPRYKNGSYEIPDYVQNIPQEVFTKSELTSLTIPASVQSIDHEAFLSMSKLTTLTFADGAADNARLTIDDTAFAGCKSLTSIRFSKHASFNLALIESCANLEFIDVEDGGKFYSSIDGMLASADKTTIIYCPRSYDFGDGTYVVPNEAINIADGAFSGHDGIVTLVVPNHVNSIGVTAFSDCVCLISVTFKSGAGRTTNLTISESAFSGCISLRSIVFEGREIEGEDRGKIYIGANAFAGNDAVNTVTIGNGVNIAEIGDGAFANLRTLSKLNIDETAVITKIGARAFENNYAITSFVVPGTTTSIGDYAFNNCEQLQFVTFAEGDASISFGKGVFANCTRITSIYLPANITEFDGSVFEGCDAISAIEVDPANKVLKSDDGILYDSKMTEIMYYPKGKSGDLTTLPDTLTKYSAGVFQNNGKITSVVIPASITEIGEKAFANCFNLTSITFEAGTEDLVIGANAFENCYGIESIEVPERVTEIGAYAFYATAISEITIPSRVGYIGEYTFAYTNITSVEIPGAVTAIGAYAFTGCEALAEVTFADGTADMTIAAYAFTETNLNSIVIPARVTSIGDYAFANSNELTSVTFGASSRLTAIGNYVFADCEKLATTTIPSGVKTIGKYAYNNCVALTSVVIPNTVEFVNEYAFYNTGLTSVEFEKGGEADLSLGDYSFARTKITAVNLPSRTKALKTSNSANAKYNLFDNVTTLASITVEAGGLYASKDGVLYSVDSYGNLVTLEYCPLGLVGEITVPKTVTVVANNSIWYVNGLTKITFENYDETSENFGASLLEIGTAATGVMYGAIAHCDSLEEVYLPSHLKKLSAGAFTYLPALKVLDFDEENGAQLQLMPSAIYQLPVLESLDLPKIGVDGISNSAISSCGFKTITFAEGSDFTKIPDNAFQYNTKLTTIHIPMTVTEIGVNAFNHCESLTSITYEEGIKLNKIGNYAFEYSGFVTFELPSTVSQWGTKLFEGTTKLKTLIVPDSVTITAAIIGAARGLEEIVVSDTNNYYNTVDGVLYDEAMTTLVIYPAGKDASTFTLPSSVTTFGQYSFSYMQASNFVIPEGVVKIDKYAFDASECEYITLAKSVESIGEFAFRGASFTSKLKEVIFQEDGNLETIAADAFRNNNSLERLVIPDTVTSIGFRAFYVCSALKYVKLPSNSQFKVIGDYMFASGGVEEVVLPEGITTISSSAFYNANLTGEFVIPSTVTSIGAAAFYGNKNLTKVTFAQGSCLTSIGNNAFKDSSSLESIELPDSVTKIGTDLFVGCTSLAYAKLSDGLTTVPAKTFYNCKSLAEVHLPTSLTAIPNELFYNAGLESIVIPATVTSIGARAFYNNAPLASVEIEDGSMLTTISTEAFCGCTALASINIPDQVSTIGVSAFENCALTSLTLPSALNVINDYAFAGNALTELVIPETISVIGYRAFENNKQLQSVAIAEGVAELRDFAFYGCNSIITANVPNSITVFGANPFAGCVALENLDFSEENKNFVMEDGIIYDSDMYTILYYPASTTGVVELPANVFAIAGGAFAGSGITEIVISENIRSIPESAFENCASLVNVTIPKSVTSIGSKAFAGCTSLETITIPKSVVSMGDRVFAGCTTLTKVNYETRKTEISIGEGLYENCVALTGFDLPMSVTSLPAYTFANTGLSGEIVIPDTIGDLTGTGIFYNCTALTKVTVPAISGYLGESLFENCTNLKEIVFEDSSGITNIGAYDGDTWERLGDGKTFKNCTSLETLTNFKPGNTYYILEESFYNCTSLKGILEFVGDDEMTVEASAFENCSSLEGVVLIPGAGFAYLEEYAFKGCTSMNYFRAYYCDVEMYEGCFDNCTGFTEFYVADYFYIYGNIFSGWTAEQTIYFTGSADSAIEDYISGCTDCNANIVGNTPYPY